MTTAVVDAMVDQARKTAYQILARTESAHGRINDMLHTALERSHLDQQARRFTTELVMGTTRMQGRLDADLAACYRGRYNKLEASVKRLLRMGAYQLIYMDGVPPYAALDTTVELAREMKLERSVALVNGVLRELGRRNRSEGPATPPAVEVESAADIEDLAASYSHPRWLVERWLQRWGPERTVQLMTWNNRRPTIWFRQRSDPAKRERLAQLAEQKHVRLIAHPQMPAYVRAEPSPAPLLKPGVLGEGLCIVQDPSSGAIVDAVEAQPGEVIIDLCAGPGGKTAALADQVGPPGRILSYEIDPARVGMINNTLNRLKLDNVDLYPGDATTRKLPPADKILVDVPCTGTGVLSRRADLRWHRKPEHLAELTALQRSLLDHAARYLSREATLIYATCSLEEEENRDLIRDFQEVHADFYQVPMPSQVPDSWRDDRGALRTFPPDQEVDGIFAVRLKKS